ncbi:Hypothetical protein AJAP_16180 [Amycolatopsis japonica]|uniref:exo-alpha-sialidase n=1 Tax=Amycolatopsis japonica TaxID=208439 RepID=A0A075UUH2_9PSEU|nr:exo-alpha-sialidase [Amycolatopsis japonica]AIG76109.1 Hypothetical protein AJAP_16180 [Amycolatopsis japonica]
MNRLRIWRRISATIAITMSALLIGDSASAGRQAVRTSRATPFTQGCAGEQTPTTLYTNSEVQPTLAIDPGDPRHLVGTYQVDRWQDGGSRGAVVVTSFDGGRSWSRSTPPLTECAGGDEENGGDFKRILDVWSTIGLDGTVYLTSLTITGGLFSPESEHAIQVTKSADGGRTWSDPETITRESGMALNDFPTITADPTDSRYVYLAWCRIGTRDDGQSTGPMYLARSSDGGKTWEQPRPIFDGGLNTYGFAGSVEVLPNGVLVFPFTAISEDPVTHERGFQAMAIRSADKGRTWSQPVKISEMRSAGVKDPDTGTPIAEAGYFMHSAMDGRGVLYTAWQDSRFSGGARDAVVVARSTDGGLTWSEPVAASGDPSVPAFSLSLAARRDGTVGVTYYDFRPNTPDPVTLPTDFWLATSTDAGATWSERKVDGPSDLAVVPKADIFGPTPYLYMGAQYGLVAGRNSFVSLFAKPNDGDLDNRTDIYATSIYGRG